MKTTEIVVLISLIREKANRFIERELTRQGLTGVLPAHGVVLGYLSKQVEPVQISRVVANTRRAKSTITGTINTLARHGYVKKVSCNEDHRVIYVSLTKKARTLRNKFETISNQLIEKVYGDMAENERATLVALLEKIDSNLSE
jgi:DNA-binding MarR family transcriptional regulator